MLARRMTVPDPVVRLDRMLRGLNPVRGNLVVGDEINRGAYGVVYKGRLHGEPVAVKKTHEQHQTAATAEALCRLFGGLLEEGNMLASINHPHIVRGFGAFFDEDSQQPVIVMELMLVDLRTYIENNQGSLKMSKQIPICLQIALGVQFLHHLSPPIAHRDLNDKNVLLAEDGTVKIGDLGQSKYKREKVDFFNTLAPGAPLYMPPEATLPVGNNQARYTESVDIFSLGVLAVEVADGSPLDLHVPDRREEYLKRMGKNHPLKPLVKKCLHENYRRRPVIDQVIDEITPLAVEYAIVSHCSMLTVNVNMYACVCVCVCLCVRAHVCVCIYVCVVAVCTYVHDYYSDKLMPRIHILQETIRHNEERLEHMKGVLRDIEREIAEIESHHITEDQVGGAARVFWCSIARHWTVQLLLVFTLHLVDK